MTDRGEGLHAATAFLDDPAYREEHALHLELFATFTRVGQNAEQKFGDECKYI